MTGVRHFFTVDVEEHFQVSALEPHVPRVRWDAEESRVEGNVDRLLELLAANRTCGTFFVLGWVAERHPAMVRRIVDGGHEIGSHGWGHRRVTGLTPTLFRASIRRSRRILEDLTGQPVVGYRAPSFSIVPGREWALDVLIEEGYRYDSSLYPVRRSGYGYPGAFQDPHVVARPGGTILELPPATIDVLGVSLPAGGGAYLRLLPLRLVRSGLAQAEARGAPGTFYIHPWELDPEQPRYDVPWATRIRHYGGLERTHARLATLLAEFRFQPIRDYVASALLGTSLSRPTAIPAIA